MQLFNTQNIGLIQRIDNRCKTTANTHPIKDKVADLNDALDWYFRLAFMAGKAWNFDDTNETSPPVDTQNIVSGTNRYKFSAFTEKIINLVKLEILGDDAQGWPLVPETIGELEAKGESFYDKYIDAPTNYPGMPTHYLKHGDFVYLHPSPDYSETNGLQAFFNRPASKFLFTSVTVDAGTDVFTATAHGLSANDTVMFETDGTIPTGLTADTIYYVISSGLTSDAFKVSATLGGSAVDVTNAQASSNHFFVKANAQPGIMETHHKFLSDYASFIYLNANKTNMLGTLPQEIILAEQKIKDDYGVREKDRRKIIGFKQRAHK